MEDPLNRIEKGIVFWESTISPEIYELAKSHLAALAFEALERDGQLVLPLDS
jgi:hypothetical protein